MKIDFLQIGFQKCGTSFFEQSVYPTNPHITCVQAERHRALRQMLLYKLIIPDGLEFEESVFHKEITGFDNLFDDDTVNGIMYEPFTFLYLRSFDRKNVIDRIKAIFPEVKIITFIRNQKSWLLSHYSQYLKSGGLLSLHDFIESQLNNPFLDAHYIDWHLLISYLYDVFGKNDVLVCLYEDLKESPQRLADTIFSFLNVPASKINPAVVNPSLSANSLVLRRMLNYLIRFDCGASRYGILKDEFGAELSSFYKFKHRFIYTYYKILTNRLCYKVDDIFNFKRKKQLQELHIHKINLRYGEHNRELSKLLDIDLSQYDYPMICSSVQ